MVDLFVTASGVLIDLTFLKHNCVHKQREMAMFRMPNEPFCQLLLIVKELILTIWRFLHSQLLISIKISIRKCLLLEDRL